MRLFKMAVAVDLVHGFKPFARPPRLKRQSFTQHDYKMLEFTESDHKYFLSDFTNIHKSFSTPCLSQSSRQENSPDTNSRIEIIVGHAQPRIRALVLQVSVAMASGVSPEPAANGLGGAYFLCSQHGNNIAVAKPVDEEPLAFNNPKGFVGRMLGQPGMKSSIRIGETGIRESAAYLLDHDGFSGVPPTALVKFSNVMFNDNGSGSDSGPHYKIASLQCFVDHDSDAGDLGPSGFLVASVHKIGILDVRLMNLDRHAGNILVRLEKESYGGGNVELVPIDHGFCLPESLDDPFFEWLHWPQASLPFSESEIDYISSLDPYKDAELLRNEIPSFGESSIRVLVLCTIFLKEATAYGMCLADLGEMMTREFDGGEGNWSELEKVCLNAKASMKNEPSDGYEDSDQYQEFDEMFQCDDVAQHVIEGTPSKISSMTKNSSLRENEDYSVDDLEMDDSPKTGFMMRSLSFPMPKYNHGGEGISFGEMNVQEWGLFLENFEKLLPQAFEERKAIGLLKQRLGFSCEF